MTVWLRIDYFIHRWIGAVLGTLVLIWFASGIVMMYYPYPSIAAAREIGLLRPFAPDSALIGFARARDAAARSLEEHGTPATLVAGRLERAGDRLVYRFLRDRGDELLPAAVVDARSGAVLSPIESELAVSIARRVTGDAPAVAEIELEQRADHYMMDVAYAPQFPAWRVQFADPRRTAVYVGAQGGAPFGIVTRLTRVTTWTGTVPHWFYFIWLYDRPVAWGLAFVVCGSLVLLLALTGIVWGIVRLFPHRSRGDRRLTVYRGISRWHHLSGIVFGLLVLSWTASGLYQNFGAETSPRSGQAARVRRGATRWDAIHLTEAQALERLRQDRKAGPSVQAIDLVQFDDRPGFEFHFSGGRSAWVDAESGAPRDELAEADLVRAAGLAMGGPAPIERGDRITSTDEYYYARHGREVPLPVWRMTFREPGAALLYLDPITGAPVAFVSRAAKRARWLRDAVHSFDYRALNNHRPLWDLVMLPLLLGGALLSGTGLVLMLRRARAAVRRASR